MLLGLICLTVPAAGYAKSSRAVPNRSHRSPILKVKRPRIIGGQNVGAGELGFLARVTYDDGTNAFLCSGTLISSNVVLTAGHCAEDTDTGIAYSPSGYEVMTGTSSLSTPGQVSGVSRVIPYPTFDPSTLHGDAGLLVLSSPAATAPVPLATSPTDASLYAGGSTGAIVGWGVTDDAGDLPDNLQYGTDVVQDPGYCAQQASQLGASFDTLSQLCAIYPPSYQDTTCNGDSGGPLLEVVNDAWIEAGITSFGPSGCSTTIPAYFTRADAIAPWANQWITAVAPTSTPSSPPTTPPPSHPAPAPTSKPLAGTYRGRTGQREPIRLRVSSNRHTVLGVGFEFRLACTRHRPLYHQITRGVRWTLNTAGGMGFTHRFTDPTGTHYALGATFTTRRTVQGTMRITWRTRRYGTCASGLVRWHASR
ncbi:MAG: serine protease [Solirubrobacterales bacterium]|nr:serine protease [Solirubrobacterales bacterium]